MQPGADVPDRELILPTRPIIEIDTPRLRRRRGGRGFVVPSAAITAPPRVLAFSPDPRPPPESRAMARHIRDLIEARGWGLWAVEVRGGARFIGFVGLHVPPPEVPCAPCVEIGWRLAHEHWGHGYATEAARAVLEVGFERLRLDEIVSFTAAANLRSQAVMHRLGMRRESASFDHPSIPPGHPLREHVLYRLRREDWERGA